MSHPNPRARPTTSASTTRTKQPYKNPSATKSTPKPLPKPHPSAPSKPSNISSRPTPRNAPSGTKPANTTKTPSQPQPQNNWLNRSIQNSIAGVGNYAGGFITSIGDSVNKVGANLGNKVSDTTRYWGQGVSGYGNDIKDKVGVGGPRVATGGNPLGLAGMGSSKTAMRTGGGVAKGGHLGL